jgi:uncharacterized protein (DUF1697 family)
MSMADWRAAVADAGFSNPETYVATGNMIVEGDGTAAAVARRMDEIVQSLGLAPSNKAIVRTPGQLQRLIKADPFPDASTARPSALAAYFAANPRPDFSWVADYDGPERIAVISGHLVVDYHDKVTGSSLSSLIERKSGTMTARNWNTLRSLAEKAAHRGRA